MLKLKKYLIYTHRYLGLAFCAMFALWFVSGVVMMYRRMPRLPAEERLARLPTLDFSRATLTPDQAYQRTGWSEAPSKVRLGMFNGRPVYRFLSEKGWATFFADDGGRLDRVTPEQALDVVRAFAPELRGMANYKETVKVADQWTLGGSLRRFKPLHKVALDDGAETHLYVSQVTGEVVMKTTRDGRFWGWMGAVIHWVYFTPLRQRAGLWNDVIVWGSGVGCVMCVSGIVIGLWRYRFRRRYRLKGELSRTPYVRLMRWHHYFGLFFGLITFTWILSGLLSMNPGDWSPGNSPTEAQIRAVAGGALNLGLFKLSPAEAIREFRTEYQPKEIELLQFRGRPFYLAYQSPDQLEPGEWLNTNLGAFPSAETPLLHLLIAADDSRAKLREFSRDEMMSAARDAMPGARIAEATWLDQYDAYYYHRARGRRLPALRVKYDDPQQTWLYFDPKLGAVAQKEETRSRIERWLYNGLHSMDFPYLYQRRPAWDITVIVLSLGGCLLSGAAVWLTWRRVMRSVKRRRFNAPSWELAARQNCFRMSSKNKHSRSVLRAAILIITGLAIYAGYLLLRRHGIGVHELLATDGNPHSIMVFSILAYSLVFGLKHALEPDHLAAVSTIAVEHKSLIGSSLVGAVWGVGHTLSLLLAGLVVILLGFDLREEYLKPVEVIVALMLIGLGARALWKLWRERKTTVGAEQREALHHAHIHHAHPHSLWERIGVRPLLIGMVHGLAGSAALLLLLIPVIPSTALKIVYILVFGAGSIAGMVIMSCMVGLPTHLMATRFLKVSLAVRALAGLFSLGFGAWLLHEFIAT